jgi:hypothetical protein
MVGGFYWLTPGSPAIGKGNPQDALSTDFWGRPVPKDKAPDLGAFTFVPSLLDSSQPGWAYGHFPTGKGTEMPDLWVLPKEIPAIGAGGKPTPGGILPK